MKHLQSDKAVEDRYRYNAMSSEGPTNMGGGNLYKDRLAANIEANRDPSSGYNAWNKKRQEAIDRGEDPNSALLAMIEAREPDSYLERAWRKMTGKKKTRAEEREAQEAKARKKMELQVQGTKGADVGIAEIHGGAEAYEQDDGVIR
jgi:hypothetical protein